ncbi:MAG: transporter substrate-binding domain-containing protein [Desulfobacterium sp.]
MAQAFDQQAPVMLELTPKEQAFVRAHPVIRVSNEMDWPPFDFAIGGQPFGLSIDLMNFLAQRLGLTLEYINGHSWSELIARFKAGHIDILQSAYQTPHRETFALFTRPYYRDKTVFIISRYAESVSGIASFRGKTLAIPMGYAQETFISEHYPDIQILKIKNMEGAFQAIIDGRADATVELFAVARFMFEKNYVDSLKISGWFKEYDQGEKKSLHLMVQKGLPLLHGMLEKALASMPPGDLIKLEEKWLGPREASTKIKNLSMVEEGYLEQKKALNICISKAQHPPYEYITQEGEYQGIVAEYYKRLSQKIGLPLKWHVQHDTPKSHANDESQDCDVISMVQTGETAPADVQTTRPYVTYPLVIATDNNALFINTFEGLAQKKFGICRHRPFYPLIQKKYPAMNFIPVKTVEQGLAMVQKHSLFGFIDTAPKIGYYIQKQQILDIKISGKIPIKIEFRSGIKKDNAILSAILEKADQSLTREERHQLFQNWMQLNYHKGIDYDLLWKLGALVLFSGAFLIYRQRSMSRYNQKLARLNNELIQANSKLETISYIDGLTQVPNRRRFDLVLSTEWQRCERNQHPLTLLMIDIDYFKLYNDCYGHLAGDDCLKKVAHALNSASGRAADFTARYGGEEFAMVLPDTDKKGGKAIAQKILSDIKALKIPHETSLVGKHISVSIGVASLIPLPTLRPMHIVDFADQLLYQAKDQGRKRYVISDDPGVA